CADTAPAERGCVVAGASRDGPTGARLLRRSEGGEGETLLTADVISGNHAIGADRTDIPGIAMARRQRLRRGGRERGDVDAGVVDDERVVRAGIKDDESVVIHARGTAPG